MSPEPFVPDFAGALRELPIVQHHDEILAALRRAQVVVVYGDTGSGKTTQLPKMALEAGCGARGRRVACTQPRRLAAVTTAERVAAELNSPVGGLVGYQHRFARALSPETRIKFMTDGVLLAETRADPLLRAYDCIIVDEAHERSLNVDFLLGILHRILAKRRDLKVIVSSATIDTERFSAFFGGAPTICVPGRLFPIETRYLPPEGEEECDLPREVAAAIRTLPTADDILVFLPGERDIRETAERLRNERGETEDVIPLLASLPAGEQKRAFQTSARRRIILATNVAETSVTIPGIRFVVDSGLARLSRYVHKTQVQRLQIEPVSQASARQRMGRCGRLAPGICIRLYSEEDFLARAAYTPPEILRSSLAGVILTMLDLGLGDVAKFPFIDPPRGGMIAEGFRELIELGAIARDRAGEPCLSAVGRKLARIPVEPRLARILLAASELATLPSAVPVVAGLACEDPRRYPIDEREKAREAHAKFRVKESDFLGILKLWNWWREQSAALSHSKLRRLAQMTYLSYPKMREWSDLVRQLTELAKRLGLDLANDNGGPDALHRSLLAGLLGRLGKYDPEARDYRGARGIRFAIHPSSALVKKPPAWILCGELVDTARLFARTVTAIDVRWIESAAGALAKHHVHSPEWDGRTGFVRATEQVTLYGLVIVPARRCDFSRHDPAWAREIFIRRGLVDGEFPEPPPPVRRNTALLDELRHLAEKMRRPEIFDAERLVRHFAGVIPTDVSSAPALRKWLHAATETARAAFTLVRDEWMPSDRANDADYPDAIRIGGVTIKLRYRHDRDDPATDGVTCDVKKSQAAALRLWRADWLVPGLLPEKVMWMLATLPAAQRRLLAPLQNALARLLPKLKPGRESLVEAVVRTIREEWGFRISAEAWSQARMPDHLRMRYLIRDDATGRPLAISRDLDAALEAAGVTDASVGLSPGTQDVKHVRWDFGALAETARGGSAGWALEHYPALRDEGDGVKIVLAATPEEAARLHARGVLRLFLLALGEKAQLPFRTRDLSVDAALYVKQMEYPVERIAADILAGAAQEVLVAAQEPVRTPAEFTRRLGGCHSALVRTQTEMAGLVRQILDRAAHLQRRLEGDARIPSETAEAVQTELAWLTPPGFPRTTPLVRLRAYERYLKAAEIRLDRARLSRSGDQAKEARFAPYWQRYRSALAARGSDRPTPETLARFRWMLEEFRVSLFAQELHTPEPISEKRLDAVLGGDDAPRRA